MEKQPIAPEEGPREAATKAENEEPRSEAAADSVTTTVETAGAAAVPADRVAERPEGLAEKPAAVKQAAESDDEKADPIEEKAAPETKATALADPDAVVAAVDKAAADAEAKRVEAAAVRPPQPPRSPEFLKLAEPVLPVLPSQTDQARLLMQSPTRLHFYWSINRDPFRTLRRALGSPGNYSLVLKLIDVGTGREEVYPAEPRGNRWFDVFSGTEYRAEIGFVAAGRPYIRILFSNNVRTPRKSPSPASAEQAEFKLTSDMFARVLDAAGFRRDAFDVAFAGDDRQGSDTATRSAFARITGRPLHEAATVDTAELRYALFALASGISPHQIREIVGERIMGMLPSGSLTAERLFGTLREEFEIEEDDLNAEVFEPEHLGGSSDLRIPAGTKKKRRFGRALPDLATFSSHSLLN